MIWKLWLKWRARHHRRAAMSHLLHQADDHLLRDIGMTREDLRRLLERLDD